MKNFFGILFVFLISSLNAFAGGSIIGSGGTSGKMENFSATINLGKSGQAVLGSVKQKPNQVYYMRQKQAEIQFATNTPGDNKVEIQSLRPEEIGNPALLEGLKRSQQTRQWENVKLPNKAKFDDLIKNFSEPESGVEQ